MKAAPAVEVKVDEACLISSDRSVRQIVLRTLYAGTEGYPKNQNGRPRASTHVNSCTSTYSPRLSILFDTVVPIESQEIALKAGKLYALSVAVLEKRIEVGP